MNSFLASLDTALGVAFANALHGLALAIAGCLALVLAVGAARELGDSGPRWRWFGWFALLKGLAVIASLVLGSAHAGGAPAFFSALYVACALPAWLAGAQFAWRSLGGRSARARPRAPLFVWLACAALAALLGGLHGLEVLLRALGAVVGAAMLATLVREIRAEDRRPGLAALGLLLAFAGLGGLVALETLGPAFHSRLQGWTLNTLSDFVRRDFSLVLAGAASAAALSLGWWLWMRLRVVRAVGPGWLRRALWLVPSGVLLTCVAGFVMLNHLKLDGGERADRVFAGFTRAAAAALDLAGRRLDGDAHALSADLAGLVSAKHGVDALALIDLSSGSPRVAAASGAENIVPPRPTLWRQRGAPDPAFDLARGPFASSFMQDERGTFVMYYEPWPAPGAGWLAARVGYPAWSEVAGSVLMQAAIAIVLACMVVVSVVVFLIQRELAEETRLGLARASAASEAKTGLLARASHELRTPVQGVLGYADLLDRSALDARQREWLEALRGQGRHLLRLVNDLLDFGALQSGRLALEAQPFSPALVAREAVAAVRPLAEARGLACGLEISPDTPAWTLGDATRLRQILVNLLGNAVKFTESGRVDLRVECDDGRAPGAPRVLVFAVADTGPGIPPEELARIFEPRGRLRRHAAEGAGLGLALARSLCLAMDGDLGVASEPGIGSTFTARVKLPPCAAPAAPARARAARPGALGLRVLVVEDNPALRQLIGAWLEELGCEADLVPDGESAALAAARRAPEVVVLDLGLPGIDGLEVARRLRASSGPAARARIVGLSAHATDADHDAALAVGMDLFLSKPVEFDAFAAALRGASVPAATPAAGGLLDTRLLSASRIEAIRAIARAESPARVAELRAALAALDGPRAADAAHYLANTADVLGDEALRAACLACETAALAGDFPSALVSAEKIARLA